MSIPALDDHGLLPAGVHDCSVEEMQASFGWNEHRRALIGGLSRFLSNEIFGVFDYPVYADGSFVTDKKCPDDIDIVLELRQASDAESWRGLTFLQEHQGRIRGQYGVDFWVNFRGTSRGIRDFVAFFQYVGHKTAKFKGLESGHPKGILRIM